jgi:hypothetical protein
MESRCAPDVGDVFRQTEQTSWLMKQGHHQYYESVPVEIIAAVSDLSRANKFVRKWYARKSSRCTPVESSPVRIVATSASSSAQLQGYLGPGYVGSFAVLLLVLSLIADIDDDS